MKLDIRNVDNLKVCKNTKRLRQKHPLLPQANYNMIINGASNCGKTCLFINIILYFSPHDRYWIYTKHPHQKKIQMVKDVFDKVAERTGEQLLFIGSTMEDVKDVTDYDPDLMHLCIFDDFVLEKDQTKIIQHFLNGRHNNISNCYVSQRYTNIPRAIRLNTCYFCIFGSGAASNKRECNILYGETSYGLSKEEFMRRFKCATADKFSFFFIDNKTKIPQLQFRKNFNYVELK